jgi:hypothetical protein
MSGVFSAERFLDFKDTQIYDAGAGKNDCLIRSLLYSLSESYRYCDGGLNKIASYFRRAFLPYFFDINRQYFFDIYKKVLVNKLFFEEEGILFIRYDNNNKNLNNLLGSSSFLPQIIAELLCKKLNVNLLIFTPPVYPGLRTNNNIQKYTPTLSECNGNKLISICGDNRHFRSCKISYNNQLSFIIDIECNNIENIVNNILRFVEENSNLNNGVNIKNKKRQNPFKASSSQIHPVSTNILGNNVSIKNKKKGEQSNASSSKVYPEKQSTSNVSPEVRGTNNLNNQVSKKIRTKPITSSQLNPSVSHEGINQPKEIKSSSKVVVNITPPK